MFQCELADSYIELLKIKYKTDKIVPSVWKTSSFISLCSQTREMRD